MSEYSHMTVILVTQGSLGNLSLSTTPNHFLRVSTYDTVSLAVQGSSQDYLSTPHKRVRVSPYDTASLAVQGSSWDYLSTPHNHVSEYLHVIKCSLWMAIWKIAEKYSLWLMQATLKTVNSVVYQSWFKQDVLALLHACQDTVPFILQWWTLLIMSSSQKMESHWLQTIKKRDMWQWL